MRSKHRTRVPARPSAPAQDLCTHKDKRNSVIPPAQRGARRVRVNALRVRLMHSRARRAWRLRFVHSRARDALRLSSFYLRACLGKKEKTLATRRD